MRYMNYNPDGRGSRPHPVHDMPPVIVVQDTRANPYALPERYDYLYAVTDVPCPRCETGIVRRAEAGYVPGHRRCDGCGRRYMARGTAVAPILIELEDDR